jgi:hypothetical protein
MTQLKYQINYYYLDNGSNLIADTTMSDDVVQVDIRKAADAKSNIATVRIVSPTTDLFSDGTVQNKYVDDNGDCIFRATTSSSGYKNFEERVDIYSKYVDDPTEDIVTDSNLLFSGQIKEVSVKDSNTEIVYELECSDRTFNLLNRIYGNQYRASNVPTIIQNIIRKRTQLVDTAIQAYNTSGTLTKTPLKYMIDARLFSASIKQSTTAVAASSTKTIVAASATFVTNNVAVGDIVRNTTTNEVAIVKTVVSQTSLVLSKAIFTTAASIQVSDGFIVDFRPDGSAFPTISFGYPDKPLYEWISNLVGVQFTNNDAELAGTKTVTRPYTFYIDSKNRFHMFLPDQNATYNITTGVSTAIAPDTEEHIVYDVDFKRGIYDVVNFIIFKAGEDMNNKQVRGWEQDPSAGPPMVKDSFRPFLHVARQMKRQDAQQGNITYNSQDSYNYPSAYPVTPAWNTSLTASSNSDYNTKFREEARRRGREEARKIINNTGSVRWRGNTNVKGKNYVASDLVRFTDKRVGIQNILVRITDVKHNFDKLGWSTMLSLEEDVPPRI